MSGWVETDRKDETILAYITRKLNVFFTLYITTMIQAYCLKNAKYID